MAYRGRGRGRGGYGGGGGFGFAKQEPFKLFPVSNKFSLFIVPFELLASLVVYNFKILKNMNASVS